MVAAGVRRHPGEITTALIFDLVEPEGAPRTSPLHHRHRALRKPRSRAQRCLLNISGRACRKGFGSSVSEYLEVPAARGRQHADHHGGTGNWDCAFPRVFAGAKSSRSKGKELALLRIAARALQLFLQRRTRETKARRSSYPL